MARRRTAPGWSAAVSGRKRGKRLTDVIRVNVSLIDINRFAEMDAIYCEYFSEPYPTRNTIGVRELWGGAQVGFDVWAVVDDG